MRLRLRLRNLQLASQRGFTTVTLMGVLAVGALLVAASFAAVDPDISLSREDQDQKQAYGAAESGLQWYLNALAKDNNYYLKCTAVPAAECDRAGAGEPEVGRRSPRVWRKLPGEKAEYTVELLPAPGKATCSIPDQWSMIDAYGNMRLRVTGRSRGEYRSVIATLRRRNFIDFIYFTDFETLDPAAYSNPDDDVTAVLAVQGRARRERLHRDPVHEQRRRARAVPHERQRADLRHAAVRPHAARHDRDQRARRRQRRLRTHAAGSTPDLQGTLEQPAGTLGMPPSNQAIKDVADPSGTSSTASPSSSSTAPTMIGCRTSRSSATTCRTRWPGRPRASSTSRTTLGTGCTAAYDRSNDYSSPGARLRRRLDQRQLRRRPDGRGRQRHRDQRRTSTRNNDGLLLGLIANNFVRVYHPTYADDNCSTNDRRLHPGHPDPGRDPRAQPLLHRRQLELRRAGRQPDAWTARSRRSSADPSEPAAAAGSARVT